MSTFFFDPLPEKYQSMMGRVILFAVPYVAQHPDEPLQLVLESGKGTLRLISEEESEWVALEYEVSQRDVWLPLCEAWLEAIEQPPGKNYLTLCLPDRTYGRDHLHFEAGRFPASPRDVEIRQIQPHGPSQWLDIVEASKQLLAQQIQRFEERRRELGSENP